MDVCQRSIFVLPLPLSFLKSKIKFTLVQNIIERHQLSTPGNKCITFIRWGQDQSSSLADNLSHVNKSVLLQQQGLEAVLETGTTEAVSPTTQYYNTQTTCLHIFLLGTWSQHCTCTWSGCQAPCRGCSSPRRCCPGWCRWPGRTGPCTRPAFLRSSCCKWHVTTQRRWIWHMGHMVI